MTTMPEELRRRQTGGEEARFKWAFNECLRRDPDTAPSPTAINLLLEKPPPLNMLTGRKSVLRRRLLEEAGFVQNGKWSRWYRPAPTTKNVYFLQTPDGESYDPISREEANTLITKGEIEWSGCEYDEGLEAVVHYADRMTD